MHMVHRVQMPARVDWTDMFTVIAIAKSFGPNHVVIKHDDRDNYNITFRSRPDRWDIPGVTVVWRSEEE